MNPFWTVSLFWIAALVLVAIALAFVLPALLRKRQDGGQSARRDINIAVYRDQLRELEAEHAGSRLSDAQFQTARRELEARLAEDALAPEETRKAPRSDGRKLGYALGLGLPVAAFGLYFWLGNPDSLLVIANAEAAAPASPHADMGSAQGGHDFMKMIEQVKQKTEANPDDGEAWAMLAKTYAATEQWPQALQAFDKAAKLMPRDASVLSGYAEALAMANKQVIAGQPMVWVKKALALDPTDTKALELAGANAFQQQDFAQAIAYFQQLHGLLPPDSPYAQDILAAQKNAENRLAQQGGTPPAPASTPAADAGMAAAAADARITGRVDIAPALKSRLAAGDVLFVFARAGAGGPPVAVLRAGVGQFPLDFELNDSMAMNPASALSQYKQVTLVARVSKSGSPMAQPGDLEGSRAQVPVGASGVNLVIDQTRP